MVKLAVTILYRKVYTALPPQINSTHQKKLSKFTSPFSKATLSTSKQRITNKADMKEKKTYWANLYDLYEMRSYMNSHETRLSEACPCNKSQSESPTLSVN